MSARFNCNCADYVCCGNVPNIPL